MNLPEFIKEGAAVLLISEEYLPDGPMFVTVSDISMRYSTFTDYVFFNTDGFWDVVDLPVEEYGDSWVAYEVT